MSFFKKKKIIKDDFTYNDLPHNRWEVFKTVFKIRFGFIFKILGLTFLFSLPLFAWNTYMRLLIRTLLSSLVDSNASEVYGQIFGSIFIRFIVNIPLFFLMFIGFNGLIRVYRKLCWNEITFLSDYFDNLKEKLLRILFVSFLLCISYHILLFSIYSIKALNLKPLNIGIMIGFSFIQFAFFFIFSFYFILQNDVYKIKFHHLISNSFKFVFKSFLVSLCFTALLFLPRILIIFGNFYFDLLSTFLFSVLSPFSLIGLLLFSSYQLDKWINKTLCKQIFDKGIYR